MFYRIASEVISDFEGAWSLIDLRDVPILSAATQEGHYNHRI